MYTARGDAGPEELDARLPLSIAVWHRHVHFCGWPKGTPRADFDGPEARFGGGSIDTEADCRRRGRLLGAARVRLDDARLSARGRRRADLARRACDAPAPARWRRARGSRRARRIRTEPSPPRLRARCRGGAAVKLRPGATTTAEDPCPRSPRASTRARTISAATPPRCSSRSTTCAPRPPRSRSAATPSRASATRRAASCCRASASTQLLDPGTPFLEIGQLAAYGMYDGEAPAAGHDHRHRPRPGRRMHGRRQRRDGEGRHLLPDDGEEAPARAGDREQNRLPCIYLVDSGGAFLPTQDEVFPDRDHFGRIFYNQANMSRQGHPADRGGDGLVHGGRRLRAGDERRDRHRARTRARSSSAARRW